MNVSPSIGFSVTRHGFIGACLIVSVLSILAFPAVLAGSREGMEAYERQDFATALKEWTPLAQRGDAAARFGMGLLHLHGHGVKQDNRLAVFYLHWAATKQNYAPAQNLLGTLLLEGRAVAQNDEAAVRFLTLAAKQGEAQAQAHLGSFYATGRTVPRSDVLAHLWWDLAAYQGAQQSRWDRDELALRMRSEQIEIAQEIAGQCIENNYKGCGDQLSTEAYLSLQAIAHSCPESDNANCESANIADERNILSQLAETSRHLDRHRKAFILAVRQKVTRHWTIPPGTDDLPPCEVQVLQGPGGIVLEVRFADCEEHGTYRRSIESAIYRAEPLPKPGDPGLFHRRLTLIFDPATGGLRQ